MADRTATISLTQARNLIDLLSEAPSTKLTDQTVENLTSALDEAQGLVHMGSATSACVEIWIKGD